MRDVQQFAAFCTPDGLIVLDPFPASNSLHDAGQLIRPVVRENRRNGSSDHLLGGVAECPLGAAVPAGDHAVQILAEDGIVRGLDNRSQQTAGFVGAPARGDVPEHQHRSLDGAALVANGRAAIVDRNFRSIFGDEDGVVCHAHDGALTQHLRHRALHCGAAEFIDDLENFVQMPADDIGFLQPQQRLRNGIDEDHAAARIGGNNRVSDTGQRGAQRIPNFLAYPQRRLLGQQRLSEFAVLGLDAGQHLVEAVGQRA